MTLYILFSLPQFSFSIQATFQHFIKLLDSVALKVSENPVVRQISKPTPKNFKHCQGNKVI